MERQRVSTTIVISASVVTENPDHPAKAAEVFGRAAAGLVLEGIAVSVSMGVPDDEEDR
jgi:hypothetical protein